MSSKEHIWIIDDDRSIRWVLEKALAKAEMETTCFKSSAGVLDKLASEQPDAIITDIRMPGMDGLALLEAIKTRYPDLPTIIMTGHSDLDSAVAAYEGGAFEYLPKPFDIGEATELVKRAIKQRRRTSSKTPASSAEQIAVTDIVGEAPAMQEVFRAIGRLSRSNMTVLITGQSGTGKELVAQALHRHSPRAKSPFIAINTAAIPKDLLESELFGHERGAFTGAQNSRAGRFEQANGGTLFLDEIGDMPVELQTRLLRVLSDGEYYRVGGHSPIKSDVRIIAATHQDLEQRVTDGLFREDLYHRLNVIRIHIPSLSERSEDIKMMAEHFLHRAAKELSVDPKVLDDETSQFLSQYPWPGNVRQLENTCRWLTVMSPGQTIHLEDLPPELKNENNRESSASDWESALKHWADSQLHQGCNEILDSAVPTFERIMIESALKYTGGRRQEAAKLLGWGRNTLTRKIKELNMGEADSPPSD
ncbi:MAG: nitrogen regulation protein NR(I) [Thiotrichaceae bacterium]|nr:nitrogen regulation protein NR(I) [Thiotrichaceae bacterium]